MLRKGCMRLRLPLQRSDRAHKVPGRLTGPEPLSCASITPCPPARPRPTSSKILDQVQLAVPVRSAESFQALVRWKLIP